MQRVYQKNPLKATKRKDGIFLQRDCVSNTNPLWKVYRIENATLKKSFTFSRHALKKPPALAVDLEIFQEAVSRGVKTVELYDRENNVFYTATVEQFRQHGFRINRGFGEQIALHLKHWTKSDKAAIKGGRKHAQLPLL